MKKISIYLLCFLCFMFNSCIHNPYGLDFFVSPIDNNDKVIENLRVEFYKVDNEKEDVIFKNYLRFSYVMNLYRVYNNDCDFSYHNEFLYFDRIDLSKKNIRYLDWDVIQSLLDGYKIKITDPNGVYEDYYTPTIRELLENNEEYSQKIVGKDSGYVYFEFILQKK